MSHLSKAALSLSLWMLAVALLSTKSVAQDAPPVDEAQKEEAPPAPAPEPTPAAVAPAPSAPRVPDTLVVAGGVSLGSYQAGFSYYYTAAIHPAQSQVEAPLRVVTGASAGSINALLSALSACKVPQPSPEESMFYRVWIPVGMTQDARDPKVGRLADPSAATARSLLSVAPIQEIVRRVNRYYRGQHPIEDKPDATARWLDACETDIGFVTTREAPRDIRVQNGTSPELPRQTEKFLLRLRKEEQKDPTFTPLSPKDPNLTELFPVLGWKKLGQPVPFAATPDVDQEGSVSQVLRASASVPFAFPATPLRFQVCDRKGCAQRSMTFVDGAVYENVPVRLASRLRGWQNPPSNDKEPFMVVLDTDTEGWERYGKKPKSDGEPDGIIGNALDLAGNILSSTMAAELLAAFEDEPGLRDICEDGQPCQALFPRRRAPTASGHFANFLGFFDRSFRIADFYLGMLDARAFMRTHFPDLTPAIESPLFACAASWDDVSGGFSTWPKQSPPACTQSHLGRYDPEKKRWSALSEEDFQKLTPDERDQHNLVRLFAASLSFRLWTQSARYTEDEEERKWFALLAEHHVHSRVLDGESIGAAVRDELDAQVAALARAQPSVGERVQVRIFGRVGLNGLDYREPRHYLALGGQWNRGLELGYGIRFGDLNWLRFEAAARIVGFTIRAAGGGGLESFSPSVIGRVAFPVRENLWFQVEPYVGYARLTAYEGFFERRATIEDMALAGLHLLLIQHLYLDLEVGTCVARHRGPDCFSSRKRAPTTDEAGLTQGAAVDQTRGALAFSDVTVNAGIGWRFLW